MVSRHRPRDPATGETTRRDLAVGLHRAVGRESRFEVGGLAGDAAVQPERGTGDRDTLRADGPRERAERPVVNAASSVIGTTARTTAVVVGVAVISCGSSVVVIGQLLRRRLLLTD